MAEEADRDMTSVKVTRSALNKAKGAAGLEGVPFADWISRTLERASQEVIDRHATPPERRGSKKGGGS